MSSVDPEVEQMVRTSAFATLAVAAITVGVLLGIRAGLAYVDGATTTAAWQGAVALALLVLGTYEFGYRRVVVPLDTGGAS